MKHCLGLLLTLLLTSCFSNEPAVTNASENSAQSAIEVKSATQNLDLKPLGQHLSVSNNQAIEQAYARKQSDVWLEGAGTVVKLLPDDNKGARHQKFLVRINAQQTLLFAHNIDLAPRIDALQVGDDIQFKGEYIYNPKGGVMHWTHHDPQGRHSGWIKLNGKTYE